MRYVKTPQSQRKTYKQYDEDGKLLIELNEKMEGVTAELIKRLHSDDDRAIYYALKELRLSPFEMEIYQKQAEQFIRKFTSENGRPPRFDEIPKPRRQYISIDATGTDEDGNDMEFDYGAYPELTVPFEEEVAEPVELLRALISKMPERWQEVYRLTLQLEMSNVDAAKYLEISETRVRTIKKEVISRISACEELRKYYGK